MARFSNRELISLLQFGALDRLDVTVGDQGLKVGDRVVAERRGPGQLVPAPSWPSHSRHDC